MVLYHLLTYLRAWCKNTGDKEPTAQCQQANEKNVKIYKSLWSNIKISNGLH